MEDSFRVRVDKVFGSLASSSTLSGLWSLTDEEIEKREWNRDRDSGDASPDRSYPSNLDGFFSQQSQAQIRAPNFADFEELLQSDLQELNDDDDDVREDADEYDGNKRRKKLNPHAADNEDFDIRSSIGLDCTLDYEEEEDEYDKVAVGREKAGDRLYMRDAVDYGINDDSHHEFPTSFNNVSRDPRANHMAAKLRLKEDAETAGNFDSLKLSDAAMQPATDAQANQLDNGVAPKPILKKRELLGDGKSSKRVRFQEDSLGTKDAGEQCNPVEGTTPQEDADSSSRDQLSLLEANATEVVPQNSSLSMAANPGKVPASHSVPDYVRNPSRYTRYTLDSSDDMDGGSNRKACMDFLNQLKNRNAAEHHESPISSPKSLVFTPKKKANDISMVRKEHESKENQADASKEKPFPVGIAAGDDEDYSSDDVCAMEEDKPDIPDGKSCSSQKPGRQYRTRTDANYDD